MTDSKCLWRPTRGGFIKRNSWIDGFLSVLVARLFVGGIVGALPSSRLEDVSETLHRMLRETRGRGMNWLKDAVALLPETSASAQEKEKFLAAAVQAGSEQTGRLRYVLSG